MLIGGDLEAGILSQPTGEFPEGARQPRLIVLATGRKQSTPIIHIRWCTYDNESERKRRMGYVGEDGLGRLSMQSQVVGPPPRRTRDL
jgi:hypothetical protein